MKKTDPAKYRAATNPALTEIELAGLDKTISDSSLYVYLQNWSSYPSPKKKGIICEYHVKLDSNYTVPYLVYIPKHYDPRVKTSLLVYYKGGWLSRKNFPAAYAREIVTDNPTFDYLDEHNIIEIFPVLESKLAIYGNYGYKHLQAMIVQTKKIFNIDDNKVFLAGFSDGGKTVYLASNLVPTSFACFYPVNAPIVSAPYFVNYTNRPICSFTAEKDELTDPRSISTKAAYAVQLGASWQYHLLSGKRHFYTPYRQQVLPFIFNDLKARTRYPYPASIQYHRGYNYEEFTGIDWIQVKVNTDRPPAPFHFTDSVRTFSGDGEEREYLYGEKTGQVKATFVNNTFTISASMIDEVDIYISPRMVDLDRPVTVIINGREAFHQKVTYSRPFMLERFAKYFDREQLWVNKITLKIP